MSPISPFNDTHNVQISSFIVLFLLSKRTALVWRVAFWTQSIVEGSILLWGKFNKKFHFISPGCPRPNSAFIVQESGLKHRHFISCCQNARAKDCQKVCEEKQEKVFEQPLQGAVRAVIKLL